MAFGQQSGPPASARDVQTLLTLLNQAGHTDFRDARGPLGFTQRQAAGKFTRDEVAAFIEQLEADADLARDIPDDQPPATPRPAAVRPAAKTSRTERALRDVSDELLAAELQRRGWIVMEP